MIGIQAGYWQNEMKVLKDERTEFQQSNINEEGT